MKRSIPSTVSSISRRNFISAGIVAAAGTSMCSSALPLATAVAQPAATERPKRIAAVNSIYRLRSHAYHIVGRMVFGFQKDGLHHQPNLQVVRMYDDQQPADDLGPSFCRTHRVELAKTVAEALGGPNHLDVDAVALIIEHGDYPVNEFGQILYPRYELFRQIVDVFQKSGKSIPIFCDKHLSYDHKKAAEMVATAKKMGFGLMAGSSLPVTWRVPQVELPLHSPIEEAVVCFGYDRSYAEIYLFHALECLQCLVERRRGGETGVKSVVCLQGDAVWKACDEGRISWPLVFEAIGRSPSANVGPIRENVLKPLAILIEYADGTRGAVLNLIEAVSDFCFAGRLKGQTEPASFYFDLPQPPGARFFDPLTWHIEQFFHTGQPPYPIERTLMTSTVLDLALHSLQDGSRPIESPALNIKYQPPASSGFFRGPVADRH
jgi:hypothetical protein